MFIGKVVGNVVCTHKDPSLKGIKLMAVHPLKDDLTPKGKPIIAIDTVGQAGYGDIVYLAKSGESGMPLKKDMVASDAGIMGIIDHYYIEEKMKD
ncbi:EutN/CcmL family microcompartment protein [Alteribacter natronophilus]|uniref:EutN/CcmL family microcompartment protein n=1 Tax=Alteribacter natronophilus TaxID=2583810 RepID=UPI00110E2001|nr:EutN/CcmL family microcompartment protein [Alteribacter natronophilus]TMW71037.1 ethanolamine utilization protein EutN [Alteribacter natronophilus]